MARGVAIDISSPSKAYIRMDTESVGFGSSIQNAFVILGTKVGSDAVFASKGTDLLIDVVQGASLIGDWPIHISNIAAAQASYFIQNTELSDSPDNVDRIILEPVSVVDRRLTLSASFLSDGGETRPANALLV